ncbi:MAG: hydrogenase small subunit [Pseudomonadota bacterium]|nr:hydrogenase small subunit [Pseudomonadota bacterium]
MSKDDSIEVSLRKQGISRRAFMKFCAATASLLALPPAMAAVIAETLGRARRPSVIYLSYQECTGCGESLTRSFSPTLENLMFNVMSLDYYETLQAAAGTAAEAARHTAMKENWGKYLLVVDGAIPRGHDGAYCTIAGESAVDILTGAAKGAAAVISVGTCAAFGGIPHASPDPTGAVPVSQVIKDKPVINISGCPPVPEVITGVLAHYLTFGSIPELDHLGRPKVFYGDTIHDRCYRRPYYDAGKFAKTFDDEGARNGWCLFELGCKGPITYNACATVKWNQGTSYPIQSGHGCLGCSEPDFWDKGSFYQALSTGTWSGGTVLGAAVVAGAAIGVGAAVVSRRRQARADRKKQP